MIYDTAVKAIQEQDETISGLEDNIRKRREAILDFVDTDSVVTGTSVTGTEEPGGICFFYHRITSLLNSFKNLFFIFYIQFPIDLDETNLTIPEYGGEGNDMDSSRQQVQYESFVDVENEFVEDKDDYDGDNDALAQDLELSDEDDGGKTPHPNQLAKGSRLSSDGNYFEKLYFICYCGYLHYRLRFGRLQKASP